MNQENVEFAFQIWDLTLTIHEALAHLQANPDNKHIQQDISKGITALKGVFCPDTTEEHPLSQVQLHIASITPVMPEELIQQKIDFCKTQLLAVCSDYVVRELAKEWKEVSTLEPAEAIRFFNFWDTAPHSAAFYQLMYDVCIKCSYTAPEESFNYSMKLIEEVPMFFSGKGLPHPDYIYKPAKQTTFEKCPICGCSGVPYFRATSYLMANFTAPHLPFRLWMKCSQCNNLYAYNYPTEYLQLSAHSEFIQPDPEQYFITSHDAFPNSMVLNLWSSILNKLRSFTSGTTLLEVGIGKGDFLAVALELGYEPDAVELFPEPAKHVADMLNLPIHCCDFLEYNTDKRYDIITMGDVIEHVSNPPLALKKAYQLLKPDGVLWLSTPNYESAFSRLTKFEDAMWCEPYHITYFSRKGFEQIAKENGFEIVEYAVSNRYNGSMELILRKK